MKPFFVSIPHSGEDIPPPAHWLNGLEEKVLMCDVDRFVDRLYLAKIKEKNISYVSTSWHRYAVDLNRLPDDVDIHSVEGASNHSNEFIRGLHWVETTTGIKLMLKPMKLSVHKELVENYYLPFHQSIENQYKYFKENGAMKVYQLDAHSMPSLGTAAHRDPGETRAEIVISDQNGKSCEKWYLELVVSAYKFAGFDVKLNWPYLGGRVTQTYGKPQLGQNAIQVELRRDLYMDEVTKQINSNNARLVEDRIGKALEYILNAIPDVKT